MQGPLPSAELDLRLHALDRPRSGTRVEKLEVRVEKLEVGLEKLEVEDPEVLAADVSRPILVAIRFARRFSWRAPREETLDLDDLPRRGESADPRANP